MKIYDTAQNTYRTFEPEQLVKIYVCGITPYDSAHLGHIFTFMTYDLLQRRLEDLGHDVHMVRNITDVDEPIYAKAAELGVDYRDLASNEVNLFQSVLKQLNFRPIYAEPKASDYIDSMAAAVQKLIEGEYAYYVDGDVYFDTSKAANFGSFAGFTDKLLLALMAARGGNPELPGKRQPLDFLLWRVIDDSSDTAQWRTILGNGRPGWHIECTIMSSALLGESFDLHGGGTDLIFPHHECEIAQSIALSGISPARHWLHVSPMLMAGEKMSKSLGNMVFAKDLLQDHEPAVIRLALMHYHHRMGGEWQAELLDEATSLLDHLRTAAESCTDGAAEDLLRDVRAALDDDINTLEVIDALHRFIAISSRNKHESTAAHKLVDQTLALLGLSK